MKVKTAASAEEKSVVRPLDLTLPISGTVRKFPAGRHLWSKEEDGELLHQADLLWRGGMLKKYLTYLLGKVIHGRSLDSIKRSLQTLDWLPRKPLRKVRTLQKRTLRQVY